MKVIYDDERENMDAILMKVYGLSEMQCVLSNRDYKTLLYNKYLDVLRKEDKENNKEKVKVLSLFKKK